MGQPNGIADLPLNIKLLPRAKEIVSLARQIDKAVHRKERKHANKQWQRRLVEEMDLPVDSEDEVDDDVASASRRQDERERAKVEKQKLELQELLRRYDRPDKLPSH